MHLFRNMDEPVPTDITRHPAYASLPESQRQQADTTFSNVYAANQRLGIKIAQGMAYEAAKQVCEGVITEDHQATMARAAGMKHASTGKPHQFDSWAKGLPADPKLRTRLHKHYSTGYEAGQSSESGNDPVSGMPKNDLEHAGGMKDILDKVKWGNRKPTNMKEDELDEKHVGFAKLKGELEGEGKSADSAGAIAYSIGVKKYGAQAMNKAAATHKPLGESEDEYKSAKRTPEQHPLHKTLTSLGYEPTHSKQHSMVKGEHVSTQQRLGVTNRHYYHQKDQPGVKPIVLAHHVLKNGTEQHGWEGFLSARPKSPDKSGTDKASMLKYIGSKKVSESTLGEATKCPLGKTGSHVYEAGKCKDCGKKKPKTNAAGMRNQAMRDLGLVSYRHPSTGKLMWEAELDEAKLKSCAKCGKPVSPGQGVGTGKKVYHHTCLNRLKEDESGYSKDLQHDNFTEKCVECGKVHELDMPCPSPETPGGAGSILSKNHETKCPECEKMHSPEMPCGTPMGAAGLGAADILKKNHSDKGKNDSSMKEEDEVLDEGTNHTHADIGHGDSVTVKDRFGKHHSGKAVMKGPAGWVLNMGGKHGTPGIAHEDNFVSLRKSKKAPNSLAMKRLVGEEVDVDIAAAVQYISRRADVAGTSKSISESVEEEN